MVGRQEKEGKGTESGHGGRSEDVEQNQRLALERLMGKKA